MSNFNYEAYDGMGLAELVRNKEVTPTEILEAAISKTEELNPNLNAVIHKMYDQAMDQVKKNTNGAFTGVPMLLKNITQEIKNEPITSGSKAFINYKAEVDSELVKRFRSTGAVFIGQTNVPELALMAITEPKQYGATRNPWNNAYTPGGSSGGSAAAVASGMVPIAGANDGGGSIRIPAAYCGLFGLKPSRGRAPVGSKLGRQWQGASADHVLTRSVRDSAMMLDLTKGYEPGAAFHAPPFDANYLDCVTKPLEPKRRIAYSLRSPIGTDVDPECKLAVIKTVDLLKSMGHIVEEQDPPVDGDKIASSYMTMYFGEVAATLASEKVKYRDVESTTWLLGLLGKATSAEEWVLAMREWDIAAYAMEDFHTKYDFYLTPTTAYPPAKIGELDTKLTEKILLNVIGRLQMGTLVKKSGLIDEIIINNLKRTPFTQLANLTGQPAMSIPIHKTEEGLPLGVQFMAARGREDLLYQLAGALERTESWLRG
ncbi:amidase [Virgibacillus sp. DJP39]|uniref:amidase n=1 Tax=Virgibacillus sp. DJP39 TaxID=3409790 RepID=UPI003BB64C75